MSILTCPRCKHGVKAVDDEPVGTDIRCPKCLKSFKRPMAKMPARAFRLGITALSLGVLACLMTPFTDAAGLARWVGWLGLILGAAATLLVLVREDCDVGLPVAGLLSSALSIALLVYWVGTAPWPGGRLPRPPRATVAADGQDPAQPGASRQRGKGKGKGKGPPGAEAPKAEAAPAQ